MGIRDEIQSKHSSKKKRRWILIVILVIAIAGAALWKATT
jgi:flagellar basal body-associated protein FliL